MHHIHFKTNRKMYNKVIKVVDEEELCEYAPNKMQQK